VRKKLKKQVYHLSSRAFKIPDFRATCYKACFKAKVIVREGTQVAIHRLQIA